ncbi:unnamed protein product [Prunus armeniaca]
MGKKKALEEAHQIVMGPESRLPPFDLQEPPKLSLSIEDVFAEGVEKVDFVKLRRQKNEVNLAMHRYEVPFVNVFLEGVKSDLEALARTHASSFADRAQKTILTSAYADKEIQRLKRRNEMANDKMAKAQEAIRERNTLLLQKAALANEVEELKRSRAKEIAAVQAEAKQKKAEEIATAQAKSVESFRSSEELCSYIMDRLVNEQLRWEERLAMFNPSVEINFDTSG